MNFYRKKICRLKSRHPPILTSQHTDIVEPDPEAKLQTSIIHRALAACFIPKYDIKDSSYRKIVETVIAN